MPGGLLGGGLLGLLGFKATANDFSFETKTEVGQWTLLINHNFYWQSRARWSIYDRLLKVLSLTLLSCVIS